MYKLSKLFQLCAYEIEYKTIGDKVNYAFLERDNGETLYVFFQGSVENEDWRANFDFVKQVYGLFKVHRGFYDCYYQVRSVLLDKIYSKEYTQVIIVGYSHGGSLTQLALQDCVYHFPNKVIKGYAFESPRCLKVPKRYRFYWDNLTTTQSNWDIVCHCPPKILGFNDLGTQIKLKGDTSLVKERLPKCVKSHMPSVVLDGLMKYEKGQEEDGKKN